MFLQWRCGSACGDSNMANLELLSGVCRKVLKAGESPAGKEAPRHAGARYRHPEC
jgi:hypothetical protein